MKLSRTLPIRIALLAVCGVVTAFLLTLMWPRPGSTFHLVYSTAFLIWLEALAWLFPEWYRPKAAKTGPLRVAVAGVLAAYTALSTAALVAGNLLSVSFPLLVLEVTLALSGLFFVVVWLQSRAFEASGAGRVSSGGAELFPLASQAAELRGKVEAHKAFPKAQQFLAELETVVKLAAGMGTVQPTDQGAILQAEISTLLYELDAAVELSTGSGGESADLIAKTALVKRKLRELHTESRR